MFTEHQGNMVEYVITITAVILVVGAILFTIYNAVKTQGTNAGGWITSVNVPATHP